MTTTINGRTPGEIKKGLKCCKPKWEHDRWISCSDDCPFMNEGAFCRIKMQACVSALLQQLERERDAAVEDLTIIANNTGSCIMCKHRIHPGYVCDRFEREENCYEWRGVQEVE